MNEKITDTQVRDEILRLLAKRAATSSICPSDAARALCANEKQWRELMPQVRRVAYAMAERGEIEVTQGGVAVTLKAAPIGPIRLRLLQGSLSKT